MTITKEQLKEFIVIYKKNFGTDISEKEALSMAIPLLTITKYALFPNVEIQGKK